jgi:hypothetical protein
LAQVAIITNQGRAIFDRCLSDQDVAPLVVFLADEENRIELPNRRAGQSGSFARKAVAELVPEILEISGLLRHGRAEALKRWLGGPDIAVKLDFAFFGIERDQQYVVDGLQPVAPLWQHDRCRGGPGLLLRQHQAVYLALAKNLTPYRAAAHVTGSISRPGLAALNDMVTGQAAVIAVIDQFEILVFAMLIVSPLVLFLRKPRPAN